MGSNPTPSASEKAKGAEGAFRFFISLWDENAVVSEGERGGVDGRISRCEPVTESHFSANVVSGNALRSKTPSANKNRSSSLNLED